MILFLDILGIKDFVEQTVKKNEASEELLNNFSMLIHTIREKFILDSNNDHDRDISAAFNQTKSVTQFSDSIVISVDCNVYSDFEDLIIDIISIIRAGYFYGFIFRSSITYGDIIHDSTRLLGPGFITAYKLEQEKAIFPRVIIDQCVFELPIINCNNEILLNTLKSDSDGTIYIDPFNEKNYYFETDDVKLSTLKGLQKILKLNIDRESRVKNKYDWLNEKYIEYISLIR